MTGLRFVLLAALSSAAPWLVAAYWWAKAAEVRRKAGTSAADMDSLRKVAEDRVHRIWELEAERDFYRNLAATGTMTVIVPNTPPPEPKQAPDATSLPPRG